MIARKIFRKQNEMRSFIVHSGAFFMKRICRDIRLKSDNRFNVCFFRGFVKFNRAVKIAVVGYRDRRHAEFFRGVHQIRNLRESVQKRIVRVSMKMNERHNIDILDKKF